MFQLQTAASLTFPQCTQYQSGNQQSQPEGMFTSYTNQSKLGISSHFCSLKSSSDLL